MKFAFQSGGSLGKTGRLFTSQRLRKKSEVSQLATPWTLVCQAPLSMRILQARILEWVAISFPRGSSQPMDRTWVSHIAGRFFTIWATGEALSWGKYYLLQSFLLPTAEYTVKWKWKKERWRNRNMWPKIKKRINN